MFRSEKLHFWLCIGLMAPTAIVASVPTPGIDAYFKSLLDPDVFNTPSSPILQRYTRVHSQFNELVNEVEELIADLRIEGYGIEASSLEATKQQLCESKGIATTKGMSINTGQVVAPVIAFEQPVPQIAQPPITALPMSYIRRAEELIKAGDYGQARELLQLAIHQTIDPIAQAVGYIAFARLLQLGDGGPKDEKLAREYLEKAARQDASPALRAKAYLTLAVIYFVGRGVQQDFAIARAYLAYAINQSVDPVARSTAQDLLKKIDAIEKKEAQEKENAAPSNQPVGAKRPLPDEKDSRKKIKMTDPKPHWQDPVELPKIQVF